METSTAKYPIKRSQSNIRSAWFLTLPRRSRLHNRHANRAVAEAQTPPLRSSAPSVPARGLMWILAPFVRTLDRIFSRKISPEGRKNAGSQPSHLLHSVSQVYILSHS